VSETSIEPPVDRRRALLRVLALLLFVVVSVLVAHLSGLTEYLSRDRIRELIVGLGPAGVVAFIGIFAVGELAHVPGFVFVAAAILAYGRVAGGVIGYVGALISVTVAFTVARAIGGQAFTAIRSPFVRRVLARVEERPMLTVLVLRALLAIAPPITYGLAFTRIKFRDYFVGSAIGLVPPLIVMSVFFDWLLS
jgi:uncharacterized membrane protein YdjX (TVP38/TMEM64 family)